MRVFAGFIILFFASACCFGQPAKYDSFARIARKCYERGDYKKAVKEYRYAALTYNGLLPDDRYKDAIAWSALNNADSVFYCLFRLQERTKYLEPHLLLTEKRFDNMHSDERWEKLLNLLNPRHEVYNDSLAKVLEFIYQNDQKYRLRLDSIRPGNGWQSKQISDLWDTIHANDVMDEMVVIGILEKYGWLSEIEVGKNGNKALWLVIQHADLDWQEKYYPMMEAAVEKRKASKADLAYLRDRILMREGKKQLYGSQYTQDTTGKLILYPVESPDSLNIRRLSVGLPEMKIPE